MDYNYRLGRVLFKYRTTIQETTGKTPSFLLNGWELRSTLDLMRPEHDVKRQIQDKLETKVSANGKIRELEIGDNVGIYNEASRYPKWVKGVVLRRLGGRTYEILRENGLKSTKHIDTLRKWLGTTKQTATLDVETRLLQRNNTQLDKNDTNKLQGTLGDVEVNQRNPTEQVTDEQGTTKQGTNEQNANEQVCGTPGRRYPRRSRRAPERLFDEQS